MEENNDIIIYGESFEIVELPYKLMKEYFNNKKKEVDKKNV